MNKRAEFICEQTQRLDIFLATKLEQTRSQIGTLLSKNCVSVDGKIVTKNGFKLKENSQVDIIFPALIKKEIAEVDFDIEIIYEDDDILIINKPSGLTVHPAPSVKEKTLVDWLKKRGIALSTIGGDERHGIVHRLDKGTSGAMIIAKNNSSHYFLSKQLQDKSMGRYYTCVIEGLLKNDIITVEKNISRNKSNRLKMSHQNIDGRYAKTDFKSICSSKDEKLSLVVCKLYTGRTHQIRVHLESLNRHIVGDELYATGLMKEKSERILLHAHMIYFIHPRTKERLFFVANFDTYMLEYIKHKFKKETIDEITTNHNIKHYFNSAF